MGSSPTGPTIFDLRGRHQIPPRLAASRADNWRDACAAAPGFAISEAPTYVARGVASLAGDEQVARFAGQVLSVRQLADAYGFTDVDGSRPDCWALVDTYGFDHRCPDDIDKYR